MSETPLVSYFDARYHLTAQLIELAQREALRLGPSKPGAQISSPAGRRFLARGDAGSPVRFSGLMCSVDARRMCLADHGSLRRHYSSLRSLPRFGDGTLGDVASGLGDLTGLLRRAHDAGLTSCVQYSSSHRQGMIDAVIVFS
jgi:hypothetical protein